MIRIYHSYYLSLSKSITLEFTVILVTYFDSLLIKCVFCNLNIFTPSLYISCTLVSTYGKFFEHLHLEIFGHLYIPVSFLPILPIIHPDPSFSIFLLHRLFSVCSCTLPKACTRRFSAESRSAETL